jgi:CheY-like chemotaxis protein
VACVVLFGRRGTARTDLHRAAKEYITSVKPSSKPSDTRPRALVIDDDSLHLRATTRALGPYADVVAASSGEAAMMHLRKDRQFDLVLCDLSMDGLNGLDLLALLRREYPALAARFVLISGDPSAAEGARCLAKPMAITKVLAMLAESLHTHYAPAHLESA